LILTLVSTLPTENLIRLNKHKRQGKRERNLLGSSAPVLALMGPRIKCRIGAKRT
jgi:hypothetical protein